MIKFISVLMIASVCSSCFAPDSDKLCRRYQGTLPAASDVGIDTMLTLNDNGTFIEKSVYIGEKNDTLYQSGTYTFYNKKLTTKAKDGELNFYQFEKGHLRRLDLNGHPITGNLAEFYVLRCL